MTGSFVGYVLALNRNPVLDRWLATVVILHVHAAELFAELRRVLLGVALFLRAAVVEGHQRAGPRAERARGIDDHLAERSRAQECLADRGGGCTFLHGAAAHARVFAGEEHRCAADAVERP